MDTTENFLAQGISEETGAEDAPNGEIENEAAENEDIRLKIGRIVNRIGKRKIAIAMSVFVIGGAVFLNFRLFGNSESGSLYYRGTTAEAVAEQNEEAEEAEKTEDATEDYFASTVLTRQRSRDEALQVLELIVSNEEAQAESVRSAMEQMELIAAEIKQESNIETMVKAKGFAECVAVISDGRCSVIVQTEGLVPSEVAQIQEIVYEQAGILPADCKLIEKNK